jgi:hypothetical protein
MTQREVVETAGAIVRGDHDLVVVRAPGDGDGGVQQARRQVISVQTEASLAAGTGHFVAKTARTTTSQAPMWTRPPGWDGTVAASRLQGWPGRTRGRRRIDV